MTCSSCGYMMGPFDKNCPRCQNLPRQSTMTQQNSPAREQNSPAQASMPLPQTPLPEAVGGSPSALPASMMLCPACSHSMSRKARACPHCGESFEMPTEKKVFHVFLIVWAILNTLGVLSGTLSAFLLPAASSNANYGLTILVVAAMWVYAGMWWAIARWYGRRSQPKR